MQQGFNTEHGKETHFRITRVWAKNFRNLADTVLEPGQLTVLVGANASGKSNVMDVLRFMKDALERDLDYAISEREGIAHIRRLATQWTMR